MKQWNKNREKSRTFTNCIYNCLIDRNIHNHAGLINMSWKRNGGIYKDRKRNEVVCNARPEKDKRQKYLLISCWKEWRWRSSFLWNGTWSPVRECVSARKCRSYRTCSSCMRHKTTLTPSWKRPLTLQYRWLCNTWREPMVVADTDMERFIRAVDATESPGITCRKKLPPVMYGRKIRIEGGPLNGYEGRLLTTRGSKVKRLLVELEGISFRGGGGWSRVYTTYLTELPVTFIFTLSAPSLFGTVNSIQAAVCQ